MASNRGVAYMGPGNVEVQSIDCPQLALGDRKCDHGTTLTGGALTCLRELPARKRQDFNMEVLLKDAFDRPKKRRMMERSRKALRSLPVQASRSSSLMRPIATSVCALRLGLITLLAVFFFAVPVLALEPLYPLREDQGAIGLRQTLRRLESPYRVLHIVAHPDDEDGGTLTYLSRGLGADVTIASITRGESGANLVTADFFDALGVLRTLEYRRAAQYYGARLRFSRFADFGYSKSLGETLRNWDKEQVLADLVRIIREEKPHVVLARFQGGPRDGHGHHQAAGLLAQQAYHAAGDASRFRDEAAGAEPWQPLKLYSDNRREGDDWTVGIDSGVYDPLLGRTYAQMAREGLRFQRSQGAGSAIAEPGPSVRRYKLLASEVGMAEREESIFERLELELPGKLVEAIGEARKAYRADDPSACVPALLKGLRAVRLLRRTSDSPTLERKQAHLQTAIRQALGVRLDFLVEPAEKPAGRFSAFRPYETFTVAAPGETFEVSVHPRAGAGNLEPGKISIRAPSGWAVSKTAENRYRIKVPEDAASSAVHWRRESVWDASYEIAQGGRWGLALPEPPLVAEATYWIEGTPVRVEAMAATSYLDAERVQRRRGLSVGPAVSVEFPTDAGVLPDAARSYRAPVRLRNNASRAVRGELRLDLPPGWRSVPETLPFSFEKEGEDLEIMLEVRPSGAATETYSLRAVASYDGRESSSGFQRISYPGLETAYLSRPAVHQVRIIEVKTAPGQHIGYVMGTGDAVPQTIRQLGAEVTLLDSDALASGDLSRYDTIILGIRAYAARQDLKAHNARLLEYVERGGVLVVQYNTPEYDNNYGPYPYRMTRRPEEVSEEDSPVRILDSEDPVFTWPNHITLGDFDGWVEQRGSKFLVEWDSRYKALLETHDTGQAPQQGGWLVARHGKGLYVYCAYAWYRQLPYAVPGAVRIFANLISLGAAEAPWRTP